MCLHQLPCRHLGDVNHAPSLVTGFAELEFLALGDDLDVPFYCEDSFPSHLSVEMSSSLSFSFSSSSGGSHQFLGLVDVCLVFSLTVFGGRWRCSSLQFGAIFCGILCAPVSFLLRSILDSCVGCFLWSRKSGSPSSFLLRSILESGL